MMSISEFFDDFSHSCSPTMGLPMKIWHQCMVSKYMKVNRACSPATMMKFLLPVICSTDEAVSEKAAIDQVGGGGGVHSTCLELSENNEVVDSSRAQDHKCRHAEEKSNIAGREC